MLKYSTSSPASFILYIFSVADLYVRPSQRALNNKGVVLSNSFWILTGVWRRVPVSFPVLLSVGNQTWWFTARNSMEPVRVGIRQEPIIGESFSSVNHKHAGFDITPPLSYQFLTLNQTTTWNPMINKTKSPIKLMAISGKRETAIMLNIMINNTIPHPHKKRKNSSLTIFSRNPSIHLINLISNSASSSSEIIIGFK